MFLASFGNVLWEMIVGLFSNPSSVFAVGALLAVLLGWGIYELVCWIMGPTV